MKALQLVRAMGERSSELPILPSLWLGLAFDALLRGDAPTLASLTAMARQFACSLDRVTRNTAQKQWVAWLHGDTQKLATKSA